MQTKHLLFLLGIFSISFSFTLPPDTKTQDKKFEKLKKKTEKKTAYAFIPSGTMVTAGEDTLTKVTNKAFFMSKHEVSNSDWIFYLNDLKQNNSNAHSSALPDTAIWAEQFPFTEPYTEHYLRHPAYMDYPLVGITYQQAQAYCEWLTEQYNNNPDRIFKKVEFSLPTAKEWEFAARGGHDLAPYPWGGYYLRNAKGFYLANFKRINQGSLIPDSSCTGELIYKGGTEGDYMGMAGALNDHTHITAPVASYFPNDYGLYNMAGNVEEMVLEEGISKGGSWADVGYFIQNGVQQEFEAGSTAVDRGFRPIFRVIEAE